MAEVGLLYGWDDTNKEWRKVLVDNEGKLIVAGAVKIATGSYTGDAGASRQITTGFKCSCVIVICALLDDARNLFFLIPNITIHHKHSIAPVNKTTITYLHASDGFVVSHTDVNNSSNTGDQTYYYWAISE